MMIIYMNSMDGSTVAVVTTDSGAGAIRPGWDSPANLTPRREGSQSGAGRRRVGNPRKAITAETLALRISPSVRRGKIGIYM